MSIHIDKENESWLRPVPTSQYMACTKRESFVSHSLLCLVANYKIKLWRAETLLNVYKPIRNVQTTSEKKTTYMFNLFTQSIANVPTWLLGTTLLNDLGFDLVKWWWQKVRHPPQSYLLQIYNKIWLLTFAKFWHPWLPHKVGLMLWLAMARRGGVPDWSLATSS